MINAKMIGNRIAEARKRINISQAQLGERLFISSQAVGKWERGESMPDIVTFNRLAEILAVDLNYFSESFPSHEAPGMLTSATAQKKAGWDMSGGNWVDADFSGLKDLHEKFGSSNIQRCKFVGSALNKNKVISKSSLAEHLSGDLADMLDNHDFIYAHIKNLKKKLTEAGSGNYLKTLYGIRGLRAK